MKNLCLNFFSWFKRALDQNLSVSKYNILAFGFVGAIGHPFYWFWWTYVDPQPEIPLLRIMGTITCLSLFTIKYWPENLKKILPLYWFFNASFNLPFIFTTYVINTKFSIIWSMAEVGMVFFLAALISNYALLAINITIGVVSAILYSLIFMPELVYFDYDLMVFVYLPVFNFSIVTGVALSYSYVKRVIELERITAQSLAGSIAHELRNPLNAINLAQSQIEQSLLNVSEAHKEVEKENKNHPTLDKRNSLLSFTSAISSSVAQANSIINMILSDLSEKPISDSDFSYLKAKDSLENIMAEYGYSSEQEKERVKLHIEEESSFTFKAIPERFTFIIYNLLKNALYYLKEYPESTITIGTDKKEVNGTPYNTIYIHDTGPGIATNAIPKLFGDFYTSGKKEGTGLGLAFCKRNMKLFGGDIICESELGKWTRFSLLFPILSDSEIELAKTESRKRKVLLVDDQEVNLITLKSKIERILPDISCDIAKGGKEAINMAKENKYHLILMDVQMPEIDGIEAAKRIRDYDKEVPIIALTSLNKELFLEEIDFATSRENFNYYLSKLSGDNILYRAVSKWIMDLEDQLSYVGTKEEYLEVLKDKKAILADDERLNRMMTKRVLESSGLVVTEVNNGKELLELYKNSLDANHQSSFDIIITDINMPPHNGDEATKEIRRIEAINKISHHDEMPIIALSGDGRKEDIHHFFECQMTDYFIKGTNPGLLPKIIANYLVRKGEELGLNDECSKREEALTNKNNNINSHLNLDSFEYFTKEEQISLLKLFIKNTAENISKVTESKNAGDKEKTLFHLHSIKGTAANIGADKLFAYIKTIEPEIRNGKQPHGWLEGLEKIYSELEKEIEGILRGLK